MKNTSRLATTVRASAESAPPPPHVQQQQQRVTRSPARGKTNGTQQTPPPPSRCAVPARIPRGQTKKPVPAPPEKKRTTAARSKAKPRQSLVHDTIRRRAGDGVADSRTANPTHGAAECDRLRVELERVMGDHQRQADEIVALRALARSLKEEVESMQNAFENAHGTRQDAAARSVGHEFFQLDAQVDALHADNAQLRERLETVGREKRELEEVLDNEMPRYEVLAVQARAELESTVSQLRDEQGENDRLRSEIAYYKARSRSPVRVQRHQLSLATHGRSTDPGNKENDSSAWNRTSPNTNLDDFLLASVTSLSASTASAFSLVLQGDVDTLKSELRRLHRSIDISVRTVCGRNSRPCGSRAAADHIAEDE